MVSSPLHLFFKHNKGKKLQMLFDSPNLYWKVHLMSCTEHLARSRKHRDDEVQYGLGPQWVPNLLRKRRRLLRSNSWVRFEMEEGPGGCRGSGMCSAGTAHQAGAFLLKGYNVLTLHYNAASPQNRKPALYSGQRKLSGDICAEILDSSACFIRQSHIF